MNVAMCVLMIAIILLLLKCIHLEKEVDDMRKSICKIMEINIEFMKAQTFLNDSFNTSIKSIRKIMKMNVELMEAQTSLNDSFGTSINTLYQAILTEEDMSNERKLEKNSGDI